MRKVKVKKTVQLVEVEDEGFLALMDQVITIFSLNYIYTGKLIGVNDTCVLLEEPSIVYETGPFDEKNWKNAQKLPHDLYVQINCIESFGIVK
jgi:hypothetical protein